MPAIATSSVSREQLGMKETTKTIIVCVVSVVLSVLEPLDFRGQVHVREKHGLLLGKIIAAEEEMLVVVGGHKIADKVNKMLNYFNLK